MTAASRRARCHRALRSVTAAAAPDSRAAFSRLPRSRPSPQARRDRATAGRSPARLSAGRRSRARSRGRRARPDRGSPGGRSLPREAPRHRHDAGRKTGDRGERGVGARQRHHQARTVPLRRHRIGGQRMRSIGPPFAVSSDSESRAESDHRLDRLPVGVSAAGQSPRTSVAAWCWPMAASAARRSRAAPAACARSGGPTGCARRRDCRAACA